MSAIDRLSEQAPVMVKGTVTVSPLNKQFDDLYTIRKIPDGLTKPIMDWASKTDNVVTIGTQLVILEKDSANLTYFLLKWGSRDD